MLSAISTINGAAHHLAAERSQPRSSRSDAAAAALAALAPARPLPSVSDSFDDDGGALAFLYGPAGYPATPAPQQTQTAPASAGGSDASAKLAMESIQVTALLSSLMASSGPAAKQAATASPAPQPVSEPAPASASESLVSKLYRQF